MGSAKLLNEPSVFVALYREATTAFMIKVSLEGGLHFLELGGTPAELSSGPFRAFNKRMGTSVKAYSYPPLQVREVAESGVRHLFEIHTDPSAKSDYLNIVLK